MRLSVRRFVALILFLPLFRSTARADQPADDRFQPLDVFQLEFASDPHIAPDGKRIVYVRNFMDIMKDRRCSNLWIIDVATGEQRPLTTGKHNDGSPRWSPDGKRLVYTSTAGGSPQLYCRWMDTGQTAKLTDVTSAPSNPVWSPDGKSIAFAMHVAEPAKPFAEMPPKPEGAEWAAPPKVLRKVVYRRDGAGYVKDGNTQLVVVPADGGTPRQLTRGPTLSEPRPPIPWPVRAASTRYLPETSSARWFLQTLRCFSIEHVALGPARGMPRLAWLDQQHLETARLEQLEQRDPVDAGRFHNNGSDVAGPQPVGQSDEVGRTGAEGADMRWQIGRVVGRWRGGVCCRDRNPVDIGVDVDAGGVWVHHPEPRRGARSACFLLIAGCHSGLQKGNGKSTRGRERRRLAHGSSFSTGDTRQGATKDVIAISWDQVNSRARSTTRCTVTATRSLDPPAARFGAKVYDFAWVDSFAAARNESLRHATGDWAFWLDADDRLDADNRGRLRELFAGLRDENVAYVMKCLCLPDAQSGTCTLVDHVRLFRKPSGCPLALSGP